MKINNPYLISKNQKLINDGLKRWKRSMDEYMALPENIRIKLLEDEK